MSRYLFLSCVIMWKVKLKHIILDFVHGPSLLTSLHFRKFFQLQVNMIQESTLLEPSAHLLSNHIFCPTEYIFSCILFPWRWIQNQFLKCSGSNKHGQWTKSKITALSNVLHNHQKAWNLSDILIHLSEK
jgi:hypothetical protein